MVENAFFFYLKPVVGPLEKIRSFMSLLSFFTAFFSLVRLILQKGSKGKAKKYRVIHHTPTTTIASYTNQSISYHHANATIKHM